MKYVFGITAKGEPKTELSYSGYSLWKKDREKYRQRYFLNLPSHDSPEMIFGKQIAKILENPEEIAKNPILQKVPRYQISEYRLQVEVAGVPLNGFIDSFDPIHNRFYEYKTGHKNYKGEAPWDKVKVAKHEQLPFYNLMIEQATGFAERRCHLVWLETEMVSKEQNFRGQTFGLALQEPKLTGRMEVFQRIIFKYEKEKLRRSILESAKEITEEYNQYENTRC